MHTHIIISTHPTYFKYNQIHFIRSENGSMKITQDKYIPDCFFFFFFFFFESVDEQQ